MNNVGFVESLRRKGSLRNKQISQALIAYDRKMFVPGPFIDRAYDDSPLPIGSGQTISQPTTVIFMLELLKIKQGNKILEIGAGSGWVTALLGNLVQNKGFVWSYELERDIGDFGQKNLKKIILKNFQYTIGDAKKMWSQHHPYDRIISGAAFDKIDSEFINLLKPGGIAVVPTAANDIRRFIKNKNGIIKEEIYSGFVFVPLR